MLLVKIGGFIKSVEYKKLLHKDIDYSYLEKRKQKTNRDKSTKHRSKILIKKPYETIYYTNN